MKKLLVYLQRWIYTSRTIHIRHISRTEWVESQRLIVDACFEVLNRYVEDECAYTYAWSNNLKRHAIMIRWLPRAWRRKLSREYGLAYLEEHAQSPVPEFATAASGIIELYRWYNTTYIQYTSPYKVFEDPPYLFVDASGMPTNELFGTNELNAYHPEYQALDAVAEQLEREQEDDINHHMQLLCTYRAHLWV